MRLVLAITLLILMGCASNKPASSQTDNANECVNDKNSWCEKLSKMDDEFKKTLNGIAINDPDIFSAVLDNNNEIAEYCHCVSVTKCNGIDYCSIEQCPDGKRYNLDDSN